MSSTIEIRDVRHHYGERAALRGVSLDVAPGEIFALLGPNGSGKTTLFRLLCTLMKLQHGSIRVAGADVATEPMQVRQRLGMVFQNPSLDKKLTVQENIDYQGALFGLRGKALVDRRCEVIAKLQLTGREHDRCETLSGGLKRRVELAKGMLHRPAVLLLDEPSTGLDPQARLQFWDALVELAREGTTVLLTTHLMEEADKAHRIAIMHQGECIAIGAPDLLRAELGNGIVTVVTTSPESTKSWLKSQFGLDAELVQNQLRLRGPAALQAVAPMTQQLGQQIVSLTVGMPSLEDLFIAKTGLRFQDSEAQSSDVRMPEVKR